MHTIASAQLFTRSDALRDGWSDSALTRAVRSGRLVRLRRGQFSVASSAQLRAVAAARACAGSVVSHRSALLLHGLPVVGARPPFPELTVLPRGTCSTARAHVHRASLPDGHLTLIDGVPVTSAARSLVDVARHRSLPTAVAAMDAALARGSTNPDELDAVLRDCRNWPRIRRARRAVALADGRSESPLESVSRLVIGWLGLPPADLQATIHDEFGRPIGRGDFYWDEYGVVGEADGRSKYDGRLVLTAEKERQEDFEQLGLVVARWGWDDALVRRQLLRQRLTRAFERGRLRDRSGFTRLWSVSRSAAGNSGVKQLGTRQVRAGRPRACP